MTGKRIEINPGEMLWVADKTILVTEYESVLGDTHKLGSANHQVVYMITFRGRINNSEEVDEVTVSLSPEDANNLCGNIINGLELLLKIKQNKDNG